VIKPTLHSGEFTYPEGTYFQAGYLTQKNAGWRTARPVLDTNACVGCLQCYLHCPDGTILETDDKKVTFDLDFCKGCGICAKVCPKNAIAMTPERGLSQ
jgi:2-oxoacid:acceptor oxidoreductase delta subunit (pyruvate/2-ketoisovalerate family)